MKKLNILAVSLIIIGLAAIPAQAFSMTSLSVQVGQNGDAQVDVKYELTWLEQSAVFLQIADPARQLQSAFTSNTGRPVTVTSATSSSAQVLVPSFASVKKKGDKTVLTTPTLSFQRAEDALKNYWFAPLVSANFAPSMTTITFPDGHAERYYDQITIPSVSREIPA